MIHPRDIPPDVAAAAVMTLLFAITFVLGYFVGRGRRDRLQSQLDVTIASRDTWKAMSDEGVAALRDVVARNAELITLLHRSESIRKALLASLRKVGS